MISCPYYSCEPGNRHNGICALGRFRAKPFAGQCGLCIKQGKNKNPELTIQVERACKAFFGQNLLPLDFDPDGTLHAAYLADVIAAGGVDCAECSLNGIKAKYVAKIRRLMVNPAG